MYIGNNLSTGRSETYVITASGSETSVTTSDDGRLINYTVGWVKVWLNGILLVDGTDYTATTGSSITGLSALNANDILTIEATHTFSSSDAVPTTGGTFLGNVSFGDNNITNVGSIALDSIVADGTSITISSDMETATNKKIKQKGAFMQSSTHQAWVLGG